MFRDVLRETPLTTEAANEFFSNIYGDSYKYDMSFVSTLRALLKDRIKDGEEIIFRYRQSTYTSGDVAGNDARTVIRAIHNADRFKSGSITLHTFESSSDEGNTACLTLINEKFTTIYPNFVRINKVTDFFGKVFQCSCFVDADLKKTVIFAKDMTIQKYHYLQCGILAYLPWYFSKEEGVTKEEMELIESLRMKTPEKYIKCLTDFAEKLDFRSIIIKKKLAGFEARADKQRAASMEMEIDDIIDRINSLNHQIADYFRTKADKEIVLLGLKTKLEEYNDEDSEIMDYFLRNKHLFLQEVEDTYIKFCVKDYITYYDEEMAKTMINNRRSYVYTVRTGNDISSADMAKLMSAIFIDQTLKVVTCAAYMFELRGNVRTMSGYGYDYNFNDCMPNPHIDEYNCMGNYTSVINEYLMRHDYVGGLEQCIASCKSLNFADNTVMQEFMCRMYGTSRSRQWKPFIELPDGTMVNPKEAVKWLKAQEAQE